VRGRDYQRHDGNRHYYAREATETRAERGAAMTVWGVLADVHGNYRALERAAALARDAGAERFILLGDLLGRGQPAACVAWAREHVTLAVVGNRDRDHGDLVDAADRAYLDSWPAIASGERFLLSHGDSRLSPDLGSGDEKRGFRRAYAALEAAGKPLWLFGHTHHARIWRKRALAASPELMTDERVPLVLDDPATCYLVNVGTTGRRLAGRGPASCVVLDDQNGWLQRILI
jgi:predicted phosphodiesterase